MSGNPFRRPAPPLPISTNVENDVKAAPESAPTGRRTSKTVKRVRIQTPPPLSPDTPAEEYPVWPTAEQFHSDSSVPPLAASNERFVLPFPAMDKDSDEDQHQDAEVLENTRRNSGGDAAGLRLGNGSAPNPFAKTLASMENKYNQKVEQKNVSQGGLDWSAAEKGAAERAMTADKKQKAGLDVDSFTRLLLTGKAATGSAGASSAATTASTLPPTNNTGAKGVAFGATPSARPNERTEAQPRDDVRDLSDLESASSDESDEEYTTPLSRKIEQADTEKQSIPAPPSQPAPQAPRGPQTVGFSDWDSFDSALPSTSSTTNTSNTAPASASKPAPPPSRRNRAHSNDSPLESPQPEAAKLLAPRPPRPRKTSSHLDPMDLPPPDALPQQPNMPAPPRPRAHSNLSIKSSNSSTMDTPTETPPSPTGPTAHLALRLRGDSTASTSSFTPSLTTKAPPPPPTRRAAPKPPLSGQLLSTNISHTAADETSAYLDAGRRLSPAGLPSSARSSPNASRTASSAMPPPPPPKRRGSSKGSLDISESRRGSATRPSQEGGRPAVYGEEERGGVGVGVGVKKDMFADLDALQKEVDALRKSFR